MGKLSGQKLRIIGVDESGMGDVAGPVTVCAVYFDLSNSPDNRIRDSKKTGPWVRSQLYPIILNSALSYSVLHVWPEEIRKHGLGNSWRCAVRRVLLELSVFCTLSPDTIIIDGQRKKAIDFIPREYKDVHLVMQKAADATFWQVSAASIVAKYTRDECMKKLALEFSQYGWDKNFGNLTDYHKEAILKYGPTKYHRTMWESVKNLSAAFVERMSKPKEI